MIDHKKRTTLKLMAGTGTLAAASPAIAWLIDSPAKTGMPPTMHTGDCELAITLIDVKPVNNEPEAQMSFGKTLGVGCTVILTNRTDADLSVAKFIPGTVFFNNDWVSLNSVFSPVFESRSYRLRPGQSLYSLAAPQPSLGHGDSGDYLWAQESVFALNEAKDMITLGATMQGSSASVFPLVEHRSVLV